MIPDNFNAAHYVVRKLVENFATDLTHHNRAEYNESQVRMDYIDKFFIALGWDVSHEQQRNIYAQEVRVERTIKNVAARTKFADYSFALAPEFRKPIFFVEAKKPSVPLDTPANCFQTLRYGYSSSKASLSILTNFKEVIVLDCRYLPDYDSATSRIHKKYDFTDFLDADKFAEIYYLFGRDAVSDGTYERVCSELPKPKGRVKQIKLFADGYKEIDDSFLEMLESFREELAKNFKKKNPRLDSDDLTEAVQRTLDRLVFIRFLEDKLIEPDTILDKFGFKPNAWGQFVAKSRSFDKTYNGIIFKYHEVIDNPDFIVDDRVFLQICDTFAGDRTPYHFNYIPIHILGSIYERFLGNVIIATAKQARIEAKPEVRKAGGVFYTPQYIVKYIVENTVGKLLEKKKPKDVAEMHFADIACGSGSFLLGVYDYLLTWHTEYYNKKSNAKEARDAHCIVNEDGTFHLSFEQKKDILVNNVYGVDIDRQAYEVTQLSLFLKLLEEETLATKRKLWDTERKAMLPSLVDNIKCGNTLVDWDIAGLILSNEERDAIVKSYNPMDFSVKFPAIMRNGGFDAIVGNPPYGAAFDDEVKKYLFRKYPTMKGQPESYEYFMDRAIRICRQNGIVSYIVPTNFIESERAEGLRDLLLTATHIRVLSNFRYKVWKDNASEPLVFVCAKSDEKNDKWRTTVVHPNTADEFTTDTNAVLRAQSDWSSTNKKRFLVRADAALIKKIEAVGSIFGDVCDISQGIIVYKTRAEGTKNLHISDAPPNPGWKKLLDTHSSLKQYEIQWGGYYLNYGDWLWCPREDKYFEEPKILFIRLRNKALHQKLIGVYDDKKFYNRDNFNNIILTDKKYNLKYVLGLFNSKLLNYWYKAYFDNVNINPAQVRLLPFRKIDFEKTTDEKAKHDLIVHAVEQMMDAKAKLAAAKNDGERQHLTDKCEKYEADLNKAVYSLYKLTPAEIRLIEGS